MLWHMEHEKRENIEMMKGISISIFKWRSVNGSKHFEIEQENGVTRVKQNAICVHESRCLVRRAIVLK